MASPATFLTAAYERIHFTKHSSGSTYNLLQSHSQHKCGTSIAGLEDALQPLLKAKRSATKKTFPRIKEGIGAPRQSLCAPRHNPLLHCGLTLACTAAQSVCSAARLYGVP